MPTTLLITIISPQRRVDLEVSAELPIQDLLPKLLQICSASPISPAYMSPALWGLGQSEATRFFDMRQSLHAVGVVDGDVLHLQNIEAWAMRNQVDSTLRGVVKRWNREGLMR